MKIENCHPKIEDRIDLRLCPQQRSATTVHTGGCVSNWRRRLRKCDSDLTPGCRKLGQRDYLPLGIFFSSFAEGNTAMEFQWNTRESDEIKLCEKPF